MIEGDKFRDGKTWKIYRVIEIKEETILVETEEDSKLILVNLLKSDTAGTLS